MHHRDPLDRDRAARSGQTEARRNEPAVRARSWPQTAGSFQGNRRLRNPWLDRSSPTPARHASRESSPTAVTQNAADRRSPSRRRTPAPRPTGRVPVRRNGGRTAVHGARQRTRAGTARRRSRSRQRRRRTSNPTASAPIASGTRRRRSRRARQAPPVGTGRLRSRASSHRGRSPISPPAASSAVNAVVSPTDKSQALGRHKAPAARPEG